MGGVPIDRSKKGSVVQQMIDEFNKRTEFHLAITPEGTRKRNKNWKLGFYYIAVGAKVPIQLACIDYIKKEVSIREVYFPTGDEKTDLNYIYDYYRKNVTPKFANKFAIPDPII